MTDTVGNRWYKCDLHLHTMTSRCYTNKQDTPAQWVARALEQGLHAVAVTDHNDYRAIDPIVEEGARQGLVVFPGVELTCDTGKMHMLILFDVTANGDTVRDFLNRCDIDSRHIGDPDGTSMSVFEICAIAKRRGAMVIAAHIDCFSAINSMNAANLDKMFSSGMLDAVQTAYAPVWRRYAADHDRDAMLDYFRGKFGSGVSVGDIDRWRKCYARAEEAGLPMLSFSDDPNAPDDTAHGLWGIGSVYTWLQMSKINLEGLRQALIAHRSRVRMMFDSESEPRTEPDYWIRSIEVRRSLLNPRAPIHINFHPQLTCVIGGRSSGKSSIVRILSGVFRQLENSCLRDLIRHQNAFYLRATDEANGIFSAESEIEVCFNWYGNRYRLLVTDIQSTEVQTFTLTRIEPDESETPQNFATGGFASVMKPRVFVRRQISALAASPAALLRFVDSCIPDMYIRQMGKTHCAERLVCLSMEINVNTRTIAIDESVNTELSWLRTHDTALPETERNTMIELREKTRKTLDYCRTHRDQLISMRQECLANYDRYIRTIRDLRTDFLTNVLQGDENYRIELSPGSSRASLRHMLRDLLGAAPDALRLDTEHLESIVFGKGDTTIAFTEAMRAVRDPETPNAGFSDYFAHLIRGLTEYDFEKLLTYRPEDELIISYRPTGSKNFRRLASFASGEGSGAILSLLLRCDRHPLIIDRPEEEMDSRVVYEELMPKLRRARSERQMILVTRSANIAVNSDAGIINVLENKGGNIRVRAAGSIDSPDIRRELCNLLEGSQTAFEQRARKYRSET